MLPRSTYGVLVELIQRLEINTAEWTSADAPALRALATPKQRPDGLWDVVVRIQPNDPRVEDVAGWAVRLEDSPKVSAEIEQGWRIRLAGVEPGRHRLQVFKPAVRLPRTLHDGLTRTLAEATAGWRSVRAARIKTESSPQAVALAADDAHPGFQQVWSWQPPGGILGLVLARDAAGNSKIFLQSAEPRLEGVPIVVRVGEIEHSSVLVRAGVSVKAEASVPVAEYTDASGDIAFGLTRTDV